MSKMENILQFFSIWQKLKVTVSTLFTAPRDFKFSENFFFTHCHIRANFATLWSEKVAYHFTLIYFYIVHCHPCSKTNQCSDIFFPGTHCWTPLGDFLDIILGRRSSTSVRVSCNWNWILFFSIKLKIQCVGE